MDQSKVKEIQDKLNKIGQSHLFENFEKFSLQQQQEFFDQIELLDKSYPGGLETYVNRAKTLLQNSLNDVNPYEGFSAKIPNGQFVDFNSLDELDQLETAGLELIKDTCFVLVAGGLGERLGFDGIKVSIPIETVTYTSFMKHYCEYILAFQQHSGTTSDIPLAIMTSGDTDAKTREYLEQNNYFGLKQSQVTIMKQEKIPAMLDNEARFAQEPDSLMIQCKPHGHGDVHQLLYMNGLVNQWQQQGKKYVIFFQDTNAQVFRSYPAVLGVSKKYNLEMNSICIPRRPGEAIGAIVNLVKEGENKSMTINVEYNQVDALFKGSKEPTDDRGYSLYPGNINSLVLSIPEYNTVLQDKGGSIAEFINPKYTDKTKTKFKSPTRLECMMQDYPKLLASGDRVGITQIDRLYCFSTCKNDLKTACQKFIDGLLQECAGSCEADYYKLNQILLKMCGVEIEEPSEESAQTFEGIKINFGARIILKPSFGVTFKQLREKFSGSNKISAKSTLILEGQHTKVTNLTLDGSLHVKNSVQDLTFEKKNYLELKSVDVNDSTVKNYLRIRGYDTVNQNQIEQV